MAGVRRQVFGGIIERMPDDVRYLLCTGDTLVRNGDVQAAIRCYAQGARHFKSMGDDVKALAVYTQILKLIESKVPELPVDYEHVRISVAEPKMMLGLDG